MERSDIVMFDGLLFPVIDKLHFFFLGAVCMLTAALQLFVQLFWRVDSFHETL